MGSRYPKAFGHRNDLYSAALLYFYVPHHHFAFLISNFSFKRIFQTYSKDNTSYERPHEPFTFSKKCDILQNIIYGGVAKR